MSAVHLSTIEDAARALRAGRVTSVALTEAMFARAHDLDGVLGTSIVRMEAQALAAAERADRVLADGAGGPLTGIPLGVKDLLATADAPTTAQSLVLDQGFAAGGEATAVRRLRAAGAVITAKNTTMEHAIGCPDPTKPFPTPRNPWNLAHWTGGSSSGTANGVAAGLFLGGVGTDTGGSIRLPAAWCGVTGLKPTFGRVPVTGCVPLAPSYDTVGPIARSARGCALLLGVMAGPDGHDVHAVDLPPQNWAAALDGDVTGLRLGVDTELIGALGLAADHARLFDAALADLAGAGAELVDARLPHPRPLRTATEAGVGAEALAHHRNALRRRWDDYGAPARIAIASGLLTTGADHVQVERVRRAGRRAVAELFTRVDAVLLPTCGMPAPTLEGLNWAAVVRAMQTAYFNAVGVPAISVPMGLTDDGLPVGLQIAGRALDEATVLRVADAYQRCTGHHLRVPDLTAAGSR